MRRLATFFLLVLFTGTLLSPSLFMLSIENGRVFTEKFSPSHIIKAAKTSVPIKNSPGGLSGINSSFLHLRHLHILLTKCTIPGKRTVLPEVRVRFSATGFLPASLIYTGIARANPLPKKNDSVRQLKLPISALQQSSVLLL